MLVNVIIMFCECNGHDTRQSDYLGTCFAECKGHCTRQTSQICRVPRARHSTKVACLPSVFMVALGTMDTFVECARQIDDLCRVLNLDTRQSRRHGGARRHGDFSLPSVRLALGKGFAECPIKCTRQRGLCR